MTEDDMRKILADEPAPGLRNKILENRGNWKDVLDAMKAVRRLTLEEFGLVERPAHGPEPGTCRCGAAPVNEAGLCATCQDEVVETSDVNNTKVVADELPRRMGLTEEYARAHFEARNVLDRTGCLPEQLVTASDLQMERLKACEHIADGDEGWEKLEQLCPSTAAVARLRRTHENVMDSICRINR